MIGAIDRRSGAAALITHAAFSVQSEPPSVRAVLLERLDPIAMKDTAATRGGSDHQSAIFK